MQPKPELIRTIANRYAANLTLCFPLRRTSLQLARAIHANIIIFGFQPRAHILNRLMDVYSKSSELRYTRHLFDEITEPDKIARTTRVSGYSASGDIALARSVFEEIPLIMRDTVMYSAVNMFREMKREGFRPDNFTYASVLAGLALVVEEERERVCSFMVQR
ncbi:unnamed protein product [Eruca vesicaria subsp. sativa]|uniref:Pentatricopeptide repeat-containing protein n=1 Tax=Eruca vesicaria subsp. sativa TaxID=29727 RepID=A0ABC8KJH7_ERUVS|nr:unnamed protein product [Eruca vesicaria subsp. sativa]